MAIGITSGKTHRKLEPVYHQMEILETLEVLKDPSKDEDGRMVKWVSSCAKLKPIVQIEISPHIKDRKRMKWKEQSKNSIVDRVIIPFPWLRVDWWKLSNKNNSFQMGISWWKWKRKFNFHHYHLAKSTRILFWSFRTIHTQFIYPNFPLMQQSKSSIPKAKDPLSSFLPKLDGSYK